MVLMVVVGIEIRLKVNKLIFFFLFLQITKLHCYLSHGRNNDAIIYIEKEPGSENT